MNETTALNEAITTISAIRKQEMHLLKEEVQQTYDRFKLVNVLKNTVQEVYASPEIKRIILVKVMGFGVHFLIKKFMNTPTNSTTSKTATLGVQAAFSELATEHAEDIKIIFEALLQQLVKPKN